MPSIKKHYTFVLAAVMAAITAGPVWTGPLAAQELGIQGNTPSAMQLKRLAAAVDGHRLGVPVWVVMSTDSVRPIVDTVTTSQNAAAVKAGQLGSDWRWWGPYQTEADVVPGQLGVYYRCHDWDSDSCEPELGVGSFLIQEGDSIRVEITHEGSPPELILHRPIMSIDALFFTVAAVEKFMVPYWVSVYGPAVADSLREAFREEMRQRLNGG